jgi:hypothetical protein
MTVVLHVATVHWHSEQWIDRQLAALESFSPAPVKVYAFLDGVRESRDTQFHRVYRDDSKSHAEKLNFLAGEITAQASPEDLILFLDGDAFPVSSLAELIASLKDKPLAAVQRLENNGDLQPHPCFCLTTVGFWVSISGDWRPGGYWIDGSGRRITDVGGLLLELLQNQSIEWQPLLRTNRRNLHPLWFGVYGDVAYHHGAGFRDKLCRLDARQGMDGLSRLVLKLQARLNLQKRLPGPDRRVSRWIRTYMRWRNHRKHVFVFAEIVRDPDFCRTLGMIN